MDCAMSVPLSLTPLDTSTDPVVVRRLPFVFAKRHGVLLQVGGDGVRVAFRPGLTTYFTPIPCPATSRVAYN